MDREGAPEYWPEKQDREKFKRPESSKNSGQDTGQTKLKMKVRMMKEPIQIHRPLPSELMASLLVFIKGGVVSAVVVAPFFGIAAAFGTASAFALFFVWLAYRKGPAVGLVEKEINGRA